MPGRNDECPCGSGRRFKACCGQRTGPNAAADTELARLAALLAARRHADLESHARELLGRCPTAGPVWQLLAIAQSRQHKDPLEALTAAVRCMPDDAVARLNLGNALGRAGRYTEAAANFHGALTVRPDFAEAHNGLGQMHFETGDLEAAALCCRRALEIRPDLAEAHNNLGKIALRAARIDAAMAAFRQALERDADFVEARANLGSALRMVGQLDEAVAAFRRVIELDPTLIAAYAELATALRLQRRSAEAEVVCRTALARAPASAAILAVLAELRADLGRFATAEALFKRALALDPTASEALVGITRVRRMTRADAPWLDTARVLVAQGLRPGRELALYYAMGKYCDDVGDIDAAFAYFRQANELAKRHGPGHDREQLTRTVDRIIDAHDRDWLVHAAGAPAVDGAPRPVFIVGMLRSGTTLAEQILAAHPQVFGAGELTFWTAELAALAGSVALLRAPRAALAARRDQYRNLLRGHAGGAVFAIDKLPTNFLALGLVMAAMPQARVIHMRRNPVATCLSIYCQHFEAANAYANDLTDLAHYCREYRRLMQHWHAVLPAGALLDVPYEALVTDLAGWSRRMLEFIGAPWDPVCLEFHRARRTVVTASKWQVRQPIDPALAVRWRRYEAYLGPLRSLLQP